MTDFRIIEMGNEVGNGGMRGSFGQLDVNNGEFGS